VPSSYTVAVDFSLHPNLKTLAMRGVVSPSQVIQLVTTLAAPAFEGLTLDLVTSPRAYGKSDFAALDGFLASRRFQNLRGVAFWCRLDDSRFLRRMLPSLEAAGVLNIRGIP
jgi:hypothetical protein